MRPNQTIIDNVLEQDYVLKMTRYLNINA